MKSVIFDIDGTLADTSKRVHHVIKYPKNWDAFHAESVNDDAHAHIVELAQMYQRRNYGILLCSGRDEAYRDLTIRWVVNAGVIFNRLYMRPAGDRRDDSIIKIELLAKMRVDGFEPFIAFDDRDRVVAAWREAGIPCLQVAPGNF
jgi:phosphoglycolate phosphatase-like HAD superfamily hydrolase